MVQIPSPLDDSMFPDPDKVSGQSPGADLGISKATDVGAPNIGKAASKVANAAPDLPNLPNPVEKAGNPIDSIKGVFGQ